MSQPDYYGGYNNAPTSQPAPFNPAAMPPGMPPMPPAPMSGMPSFPPGFPMPPPPMAGQPQQSAPSGNHQQHGGAAPQQYGAPQQRPASQQFNQQSQYGQQQSKPSYNSGYGQQNNFNAQNQNQGGFSGPPKNENRDVIENQIFITNLNTSKPPSQEDLKERFGSIGIIKMDKKTRQPRIKLWPEKGCASVTYEDPSAASAAISWFSGKEFAGSTITVELATKSEEWSGGRRGERSGGRGGRGGYGGDRGHRGGRDFDRGGRDRSPRRRSRSRSPNRGGGQKDGDWTCNECNNSNFARRTECNRCKAPKPGGGGGGGYGGDRRGNDRGGYDRRDRDRRDDRRDDRRGDRRDDRRGGDDRRSSYGGRGGGRGGGNVRDGDWPCSKCGVNNFASRSECFKCHASK